MKTKSIEYNAEVTGQTKKLALWAAALFLLLPLCTLASGVVTNCTEVALRAALAGGGEVTFSCDGTIILSATININDDTVLDGVGHQVTLSGGNLVRVLVVNNEAHVTLANLAIANGHDIWGGGIYNNGTLNLTSATIRNNQVVNQSWAPPSLLAGGGCGAGIYNNGMLIASNCQFTGNTAYQHSDWDVVHQGVDPQYVSTPCQGGAIYSGGQLILLDCWFSGNAVYGGAGYVLEAFAFPSGPWYQTAASGGRQAAGGAVYSSGPLTVSFCTFTNNSALSGPSAGWVAAPYGSWYVGVAGTNAYGGAVSCTGPVSIDASSFVSNRVVGGLGGPGMGDPGMPYEYWGGASGGPGGSAIGGALFTSGSGHVSSSTFAMNAATGGQGGGGGSGIHVFGFPYGTSGGRGGTGGPGEAGAVFNGGTLALIDCTFARNSGTGGQGGQGGPGGSGTSPGGAGGAGGGGGLGGSVLCDTNGWLTLTNCTIGQNSALAGQGGMGGPAGGPPWLNGLPGSNGLALGGGLASAGAKLINCLLATNVPANCLGELSDLGHNLSSDASCAFTNVGSMNNTDPKLGPLANYGGPTLTMALLAGSPAIDAGDPLAAPLTDQRGYPRPSGMAPDIGAFEYGSVLPGLNITLAGPASIDLLGTGNPSQSCRLLGSSDLSNWSPMATNHFGVDGKVLFHIECDYGIAVQFYRLVTP